MMLKAPAALLLIALSFSGSVGCKNAKPATENSIDTGVATINLSAVTKSNQTQTFLEVTGKSTSQSCARSVRRNGGPWAAL
jgi:hypothetical protein